MDADDFVTLSVRKELVPAAGVAPEEAVGDLLSTLTGALREAGGVTVGHIKGMVEGGGAPPLFFSLTSLDESPRLKGGPLPRASALALSMNVIVAGIDGSEAGRLLDEVLGERPRSR